MRPLGKMILWGATGQARVLRECMAHAGHDVVAVFDNDSTVECPFPGVPLFVGRAGFERWRERQADFSGMGFLVAIGGEMGRDRLEIQEWLGGEGLSPLTAVHPRAFVAADARVGEGSQILAQAAVCVEATIGRACIVNTGATIDHECVLGDGVHVAPGAHLAGCVEIGNFAMIGTGASILPRVRIGENAIIGAGAVVTRNVEQGAVMVGNPARRLEAGRKRE
jgi:sugar O-acyltransferase (sialic acid O-acetyltransferase NeuD family)